jgi:hypothetical protein
VKKAGQYLLTVRAEHLFLMTLLYNYTEDYLELQNEFNEFNRYQYTHLKVPSSQIGST